MAVAAACVPRAWPPALLKGDFTSAELWVEDSDVEIVDGSEPRGAAGGGGSAGLKGLLEEEPALEEPALEGPSVGLRERAAARLTDALGGADHAALAESIAKELIERIGPDAPHRLRCLAAALRANNTLRKEVIEAGDAGMQRLVSQDVLEWATDDLKARREAWARDALKDISGHGGRIMPCPHCGGKAIFETGNSAAWKTAKAFSHYRCTELHCGKETHVKE